MAQRQSYEPAATVVSLVPFPISEFKPGMTPDKFVLPPAPEGDFSTLLVKKCKHGVYLDENRPVLVVPTAPEEVAEAICFDYKKGQMGITLNEAEPALFWVQGDYYIDPANIDRNKRNSLMAEYSAEFRDAERKQMQWFKNLVADADDAWSKFHRRAMISVPQRTAALRLKLEREWLLDAEVTAALSECPVCFEKVHPKAIVCRGCQAILKPEEFKQVQFAKQSAAVSKA